MLKSSRGKAFLAATVLATGLTSVVVAPTAGAQEASFQVNEEGVSGIEVDDIMTLLTAATQLAETINAGSGAEGGYGEGSSDLNIVLDPLTLLLENSSIDSPDVLPDGIDDLEDLAPVFQMRPVQGSTDDGRTVVFPTSGRYTSAYGNRWGSQHEGMDIANPIGTPILSVMDGEVINAGSANGFGKWVRVRHDNGEISVYGHIATIDVSVGERVTAGQRIAGMGNEGRSTGPHLHFEIRPEGNGAVDPVDWFAEQGITVRK